MREKILLAKEYLNKQEVLEELQKLGQKYNYRIERERVYDDNDIDFYKDISDDETYLIGFWVITDKDDFKSITIINNQDYKLAINITHDSEMLNELNVLLKEIMTTYPNIYVTDEMYKDFYNIEDINSGNIAAWLKA